MPIADSFHEANRRNQSMFSHIQVGARDLVRLTALYTAALDELG
ncbi:hypothetical protein IQ22_02244 [Pseudomonas duriflava]|uniref:Uncharacterized protein n=1 Tax=Pseudomonas duriflava TaxID=459528 RepID=A0A562QCB1_9PSED|nr:hypothetical protein [Pseudomonas duriflava]TWI54378.1 hypothetical protein IQ22_02244 [Pseudomonas duriflava]